MADFIRESTRLYSDLGGAFRKFTVEKEAKKWMGDNVFVDLKDRISFVRLVEGYKFIISWPIQSFEREKNLKVNWNSGKLKGDVDILFMNCKQSTEYCTEVQVMHRGVSSLSDEELRVYKAFWKDYLESIRALCNKDWIIEDKDLSSSILTNRSL